jgi:hypothetical protein
MERAHTREWETMELQGAYLRAAGEGAGAGCGHEDVAARGLSPE